MKTGEGSRTALITAASRARASAGPNALCNDEWAFALAGAEGRDLEQAIHLVRPALSLYVALRTAFIDAQVQALTRPPACIAQVVLLGAGLDTRAARLAADGVRFFEIDHPATQAHKRERLATLPGYPSQAAVYVGCELDREDFLAALATHGFQTSQPALFVWEGVTMYLDESVVRRTLSAIATECEPRSVVLFDHLPAFAADAADDPRHIFLSRLGETLRWGIDDAGPLLHEAGFRQVRSSSFEELCRAFTGTSEPARSLQKRRMVVASRAWPVVP